MTTPIECDDCFLLTAREAEKLGLTITDVPLIQCPKHRGEHGWAEWVVGAERGWVRCICGQQFTDDGSGPPVEEQMDVHRDGMHVAGRG